MAKLALVSLTVLTVRVALACSTTSPGSDRAGTDSGDAGACCPPSEGPNCCMAYGGWNARGSCGRMCDGMPVPTDPGWTLATDDHGCHVWRNPNDRYHGGTANPDTRYCGVRPDDEEPDGGDDEAECETGAGSDAASRHCE